jgi:hypothetical protein
MLPSLVLVALAAACMGMLNSLDRYFIPALAPALFNVASITTTIVAVPVLAWRGVPIIYAMALGVLAGGVAQLVVQGPALGREGGVERLLHEVVREGIDWPDLRHIILARPYGSLANYIQSVGRAIRSSPETGKHCCVVQDHGGNHRHGSPNADRDWGEYFFMDEKEIAEKRKKDQQEGKEDKPIVCPQCGQVRLKGPKCMNCGNQADPQVRMIVQKDGKLVERRFDDTPTPPKPKKLPEIVKLNNIFFQLKNSSKKAPSDNQVLAIYNKKHGGYPSQSIIDTWLNERQLYRQGRS